MIASSYCEFAFLRTLQYRQERLKKVDEIALEGINGISERSNESISSFCAQFRTHDSASAFIGLMLLFISAPISQSRAIYIDILLALIVFRLCATSRFSELLHWQFLVGIMFDFVGGPFY